MNQDQNNHPTNQPHTTHHHLTLHSLHRPPQISTNPHLFTLKIQSLQNSMIELKRNTTNEQERGCSFMIKKWLVCHVSLESLIFVQDCKRNQYIQRVQLLWIVILYWSIEQQQNLFIIQMAGSRKRGISLSHHSRQPEHYQQSHVRQVNLQSSTPRHSSFHKTVIRFHYTTPQQQHYPPTHTYQQHQHITLPNTIASQKERATEIHQAKQKNQQLKATCLQLFPSTTDKQHSSIQQIYKVQTLFQQENYPQGQYRRLLQQKKSNLRLEKEVVEFRTGTTQPIKTKTKTAIIQNRKPTSTKVELEVRNKDEGKIEAVKCNKGKRLSKIQLNQMQRKLMEIIKLCDKSSCI